MLLVNAHQQKKEATNKLSSTRAAHFYSGL